MKKFYLHIASLLIAVISNAQISKISIMPEYNIPTAKFKWLYKPSLGAQISFSRINDDAFFNEIRISLGYTAVHPQQDTIYFDEPGAAGGIGKASFSKFTMFQISGNYLKNIKLSKSVNLNVGIGIAANFVKQSTFILDAYCECSTDDKAFWGGLVPRLEVEYWLSEKVSIAPTLSYSLLLHEGSTDTSSAYFNERTGALATFMSVGLTIAYSLD